MGQTLDNAHEVGGEQNLQKSAPYTLNRRTFLDVIWNRIGIIEFRPTPYEGQVYPLRKYLDRFGRVQVCLTINSNKPPDIQAETVVHESIHVDRQSWERIKDISSFSLEFEVARFREESLVDVASHAFFDGHIELAQKALSHLKLRAARQQKRFDPDEEGTESFARRK